MSEFGDRADAEQAAAEVITPQVVNCRSDLHADSALTCGRCTTTICPACMVHTPGGIRCKPCAHLRRPVMYQLNASHYLRAGGVSLALGVGMGVVGAIFLPPGAFGFFFIFIAVLLGTGIGSVYAQAITRVTRGKRGTPIQLIAIAGIAVLLVTRFALSGLEFSQVSVDLVGPIAGAIAASVAWQRLR